MEAVIRELKSIGLSGYESQAYASLLRHGALTPMQVAKIAKIPGPRVYDILRRLESMGFVVKEPRKREPKYSAVTVKAALERYGRELAAGHRNKERLIKGVSAKLAKAAPPAVPIEEVVYVLDLDQISTWLIRTIPIIKEKAWVVAPAKVGPASQTFSNVLKPLSDLKKRGVETKILSNVTKGDLHLMKKAAKYAEVRHWGKAPHLTLYIIDEKEALISISTRKTDVFDMGIWIKHSSVIKLFEDYFISKFKDGIPLEERAKELSKK